MKQIFGGGASNNNNNGTSKQATQCEKATVFAQLLEGEEILNNNSEKCHKLFSIVSTLQGLSSPDRLEMELLQLAQQFVCWNVTTKDFFEYDYPFRVSMAHRLAMYVFVVSSLISSMLHNN